MHPADDAGLYVHVPFCARACPYCDFDFQVGRRPAVQPWLGALAVEMERRELPKQPATIYVGGGTPSLLRAEGLAALFELIDAKCDRSSVRETTVELNPEHVDDALVKALAMMRVDRVSLGVQSFDDEALRTLGRMHDGATARSATSRCLEAGLRVSADLLVGWPGQSREASDRDVDEVTQLGLRHVSVYALTIEPGTPWVGLVRRGRRRLPIADEQADLLLACEARLEAAGLRHYEISSYACPGEESEHNSGYWTWRDYVGVGPSAASATHAPDGSVVRRRNRRGLEAWADAPEEPDEIERLDPTAAAAEGLWTGLRRLDGLELEAWSRRFVGVDAAWLEARLRRQLARGNLECEKGRLRVPRDRWLLHDEICADLLE